MVRRFRTAFKQRRRLAPRVAGESRRPGAKGSHLRQPAPPRTGRHGLHRPHDNRNDVRGHGPGRPEEDSGETPERRDPRDEQSLAGVDVAYPDDDLLVEKGGLNRPFLASSCLATHLERNLSTPWYFLKKAISDERALLIGRMTYNSICLSNVFHSHILKKLSPAPHFPSQKI